MTQSKLFAASSRISCIRPDVRLAIGSASASPPGRSESDDDRFTTFSGSASRDRSLSLKPFPHGNLKYDVQRRAAKVGVDEQHATLIGFAEREREIRGRQRLSFRGLRAGDHHDLDISSSLSMVQHSGESTVLLDRRGPRQRR